MNVGNTSPGISPEYVGYPAQAVHDILHAAVEEKQELSQKMIQVTVETKVDASVDESGHIDLRA